MINEAKKLRKTKNTLKLEKDPGHGEIRRSQRHLRSKGRGISKITRICEIRREYLYRPLLFWDQEIRQKKRTLLETVEGICIAPSFLGPKYRLWMVNEATI